MNYIAVLNDFLIDTLGFPYVVHLIASALLGVVLLLYALSLQSTRIQVYSLPVLLTLFLLFLRFESIGYTILIYGLYILPFVSVVYFGNQLLRKGDDIAHSMPPKALFYISIFSSFLVLVAVILSNIFR